MATPKDENQTPDAPTASNGGEPSAQFMSPAVALDGINRIFAGLTPKKRDAMSDTQAQVRAVVKILCGDRDMNKSLIDL